MHVERNIVTRSRDVYTFSAMQTTSYYFIPEVSAFMAI